MEFKVKKTLNQIKKHYTQMSGVELLYLNTLLGNIKYVNFSKHLLHRLDFQTSKKEILNILSSKDKYQIIEYNEVLKNNKCISRRILVRENESKSRRYLRADNFEVAKCNLCFVIDILTNDIITCYYNPEDDNHKTLNPTRYDCELAIIHE